MCLSEFSENKLISDWISPHSFALSKGWCQNSLEAVRASDLLVTLTNWTSKTANSKATLAIMTVWKAALIQVGFLSLQIH